MAYKAENLSALTYANGFTLWHYRTADTAAQIDASGYFNDAAGMLRVGDLIYAHTNADGTVPTFGLHVVLSNTGSVVNVSNAVALGAVDSD